ncbi:hypothetical protein FDP41_002317 [Naegleria fowleri]|uniref:2-oxoacid dehydrogenase acyltransferase catalytic domain-containing protein n=1 Tax=Naegleria fowleri TaxID=5763 RepID=A0A6A5BN78_NAEFO|nr:uncharacterized protein FDP41_002317 [Naegleria fowleri]KAF0978497.1 hypothetical protein FDP41_002317 [Naegleria fowleri]CAG4719502.1 unnamed protein product [Naegleria fowleri]
MFSLLALIAVAYLVICFVWDQMPPRMSARRKITMSGWGAPSEPATYGAVTINVDHIEEVLDKISKKTGQKLTLTHFVARALGLAIEACPEINHRMVLGKLLPNKTIDVSLLVACEDPITKKNDLANVTIRSINKKTLKGISDEIIKGAEKLRAGKNEHHKKTNQPMRFIPSVLAGPLISLSSWLACALQIDLPAFGLQAHPFGTCIVTSVANFGIEEGFVPLAPFTRCPFFVCIGKAVKRPTVDENTNEIVVRKQIKLTATTDHRYVDGKEAGKLVMKFLDVCNNLEKYINVDQECI